MQRPDEQKRRDIIQVAAKLFATRPFHEVRLEDVAAEARIGKGTIYIYFKSKEDLYFSLIGEGLTELIEQLRVQLGDGAASPWERLRRTVKELVAFARRSPHLFPLLRIAPPPLEEKRLLEKRDQLAGLLEEVLRQGVRRGELADPHPDLTARFILAFVRTAMLYEAPVGDEALVNHILRVIGQGVLKNVKRDS